MANKFKSAFKLNRPSPGCVIVSNFPAQFEVKQECIDIPLVNIPIIEEITKTVLIKEAATERYVDCDLTSGETKICVREIPAEYETITYSIITGYTTQQNAEVRMINQFVKISDGDVLEECPVVDPPVEERDIFFAGQDETDIEFLSEDSIRNVAATKDGGVYSKIGLAPEESGIFEIKLADVTPTTDVTMGIVESTSINDFKLTADENLLAYSINVKNDRISVLEEGVLIEEMPMTVYDNTKFSISKAPSSICYMVDSTIIYESLISPAMKSYYNGITLGGDVKITDIKVPEGSLLLQESQGRI